jgi:hypothetical protein
LTRGHSRRQFLGLVAGDGFDYLEILGDFEIADGVLEVLLIDGFLLDFSQSFDVISISGTRSGVFLGLPEGGLVGNFDEQDLFITYQAGDGNDIALFTAGLPGDYNEDGNVDAADYVVWRNNGGTQQEYHTWRAHFGEPGSGGGSLSPVRVREPTSALLLVLGPLGQSGEFAELLRESLN